MTSLCLVMIVKNEEHVIERSLTSALPFVDTVCIVDTGSTDSTMTKIQEIAGRFNIAGQLHQRPWVNFAHNRSEALEIARPLAAWSFMMDADDIIEAPPRDTRPPFEANAHAYAIKIKRGTLTYYRAAIFNNAFPWYYIGAVHEYAHCPNVQILQLPYPNTILDARCEGARSKNPKKYEEDALLLESELEKDPNNNRSIFYAAQSWRDAGNFEKARHWYKKRMDIGGWAEEQYVSALNLIRMSSNLDEKFTLAWKALEFCPRLEATHEVLKTTRILNLWSQQAYALGKATSVFSRTPPINGLFIEQYIYDYEFDDEFSIHCFYLKKDEDAAAAAFKALQAAPPAHQPRIRQNYEFALKRPS